MNREIHGAAGFDSLSRSGQFSPSGANCGGFTLLEMCIVLVILGILMTVIAPGIQSALAEQALRSDARELSLLVKSGMLQSSEEHRAYSLNLTETGMTLAPLTTAQPDPIGDTPAANPSTPIETETEKWQLTAQNEMLLPDPKAAGKWQRILSAQWVFRPGELCPATDVLFTRGRAELQMSFNALTGNVEDERSAFP